MSKDMSENANTVHMGLVRKVSMQYQTAEVTVSASRKFDHDDFKGEFELLKKDLTIQLAKELKEQTVALQKQANFVRERAGL